LSGLEEIGSGPHQQISLNRPKVPINAVTGKVKYYF
jgi:hypothetical protein